jgi:Flp pilus assembly protein TadD
VYFLAAVLTLSAGSLDAVRLLQIGLGTFAVLVTFRLADLWHGRRAAWIAALLAVLTGTFTFYEVVLLSSALDPVLTAVALWCVSRALLADRLRWWLIAGIALGVHGMNRPNVLLAAAGMALLLVLTRRWRQSLVVASGVLLALLPLLIRNYAVERDLAPASSHGGISFFIGNNGDADGTYRMSDGLQPFAAVQQEEARTRVGLAIGRAPTDSDVSAYFYGRAWSWIASEPADAALLFARKLTYALNAAEPPLNYSYAFYYRDEPTLLRFLPVGAWLLIPCGLLGLWLAAPVDPARRSAFLLWSSYVPLYAIAVAIFFVASPVRLPLLVPLTVLAGGAIDALTSVAYVRSRRRAVALGALAGLSLYANWRFGLDDGRGEERIRIALVLVERDQYVEAEALVAQIARNDPRPGTLHLRVGRALLMKGQADAAVRHLEQAVTLDPDRPETAYAYGQALVEAKRPKDAIPHLRRAYDAGVRVDLAGYDLARALAMTGDRAGALRILPGIRPGRADDAAGWFALGQLAMDLEAHRLAEGYARRALNARPDNAAAHQQLGLALANQGRFAEAVRTLEDAVRLAPNDPAAHLNLAVALAEVGRVPEARTQALEAVRLRPDYERARKFLGALPK